MAYTDKVFRLHKPVFCAQVIPNYWCLYLVTLTILLPSLAVFSCKQTHAMNPSIEYKNCLEFTLFFEITYFLRLVFLLRICSFNSKQGWHSCSHVLFNACGSVRCMTLFSFMRRNPISHQLQQQQKNFRSLNSYREVLIYLLTAIGLTSDGSSTEHIYTQTIHRTKQLI